MRWKPSVASPRTATKAASASPNRRRLMLPSTRQYRRLVDSDNRERQLDIHLDPEHLAGAYANFANVSFSAYEFTITFARIDHEVEEGNVPGVVVSRINMSPRFMRELLDAMEDTWSKWQTTEGIRNLPEIDNDS